MPAAIPDRFKLEMRLGRDDDIEEWLATDTSLDRPVLVRSLGPESSPERRRQFVQSVSGAAKASHPHLARVFAVGEVEGGAYSVSEWTGGATVADRVNASQPIELAEFLPNASGLAGALSSLHELGHVHGSIDNTAISYSVARPAKLAAFGRAPRTDAAGDVRALAAALETALTGSPPGGPPPSERIDGVPRVLDRILRSAESGELSASDLEKALLAAPTPRAPQPETQTTSRRLLIAALSLVLAAVGLVALGRVLSGGGPILLPAATTTVAAPSTAPPPTTVPAEISVEGAAAFDPFGGGGENDQLASNLIDGRATSEWRTESYPSPLAEVKPGVGVTFTVQGTPSRIRFVGLSQGTRFEIYWSQTYTIELATWTRVAGATAPPGATFVDLPPREDGFWLVWLTDLPLQPDGTYYASIAEVRFLP